MSRTGLAAPLALLAAAAACLPAAARAAEEEVQLWLNGTAVVPLSADVSATVELSRRIRENEDQVLLRGIADYRLSEVVSVGGGGAYANAIDGFAETGEDRELRLQQQLTLTFGPLALRTRVEQRFFERAERMQLRIRQRIQAGFPVANGLRASLSGEVFYVARSDDEQADERLSQWRITASLTHRPSRHLEVTVGYLLMYTPLTGDPDRLAHVPQLTLAYRP